MYSGYVQDDRTPPPPQARRGMEKKAILETEAESIEWFIEDQAFSPSYDLAPPPPPPSSPVSKLSFFLSLLRGEWGWGRSHIIRHEKAWSSINHLINSLGRSIKGSIMWPSDHLRLIPPKTRTDFMGEQMVLTTPFGLLSVFKTQRFSYCPLLSSYLLQAPCLPQLSFSTFLCGPSEQRVFYDTHWSVIGI